MKRIKALTLAEGLNLREWRSGSRIPPEGIDLLAERMWFHDGALWEVQMDDDSPVEGWPDGLF